jgi:SAM-dependent methyltransferase
MADPAGALALEYSERADAYVQHWGPVIHPMAQPLLEAMPLADTRRVLDVGTGTGALWPAVRRAAPQARVWGIDRSDGMLRAGGAMLQHRVAVMDAQSLGIRPRVFDAALMCFVLFHISDPVAALREVRSVLAPKGRLGLVNWGNDPGLPGQSLWTEELDRAGAGPDPRDPRVMRQGWMDTTEKLAHLLERGGFQVDRLWSRTFTRLWTVADLLATQTRCGLPSRRLARLDGRAQQACVERVRKRMHQLSPVDLTYHVEILYGIAQGMSAGSQGISIP